MKGINVSKLLKALSVITGSSQGTLLGAKAEISNILGGGKLSSEQEKRFVFEKLITDLPSFYTIEEANSMHTIEIIGNMIEYYIHAEPKFVQIFNRVMIYYYNFELRKEETLIPAFETFSKDFEKFVGENCR